MTRLEDVLDVQVLEKEIADGYVTARTHPEFPDLKILNYSDKTAYDRHWNEVTRVTRGLIYNQSTREVLARPFPKFFNFDEKEAPRILDDQIVFHWSDKYDGSLGILYRDPTGYPRIATRGSFASDQAAMGTKILHESGMSYVYDEHLDSGYTPLFEICGPSNRIVLAYEKDFLAPLGYIHIESGQFTPADGAEPRTMQSLLQDLSRSNAEGWVVWKSTTEAVKLKQADYIELHRMVSNLTEKETWRQLRAGTYSEYVQHLPDELYALAESWAGPLQEKFDGVVSEVDSWLDKIREKGFEARKDLAIWVSKAVPGHLKGLVFSAVDGKDYSDGVWKLLEVKG